jgi:DNA replication protein DnaC
MPESRSCRRARSSSTRFMWDLLDLVTALVTDELRRRQDRLAAVPLLIIDDLGMRKPAREATLGVILLIAATVSSPTPAASIPISWRTSQLQPRD